MGQPTRIIRGSLQEYGSDIHLVALMEGPLVNEWNIGSKMRGKYPGRSITEGPMINKLDISPKIEEPANEDIIPELIKDLAFIITYDLSKEDIKKRESITAKTWITLKYFTEVLYFYSQNEATKKTEYLENAWRNCDKVLDKEKDYKILFNLLHSIGISYYHRTYAIAELRDSELTLTSHAKGSTLIVLGNEFMKQVVSKCFKDNWKKKRTIQDAVKILMLCIETAVRKTASVSRQFYLIQTASNVDVLRAVEEDMKEQK